MNIDDSPSEDHHSTRRPPGDAVPTAPPARRRLDRDSVLNAAVGIADTRGLQALTMRSLAASLGVKPMSLYHYVANKEAILDGIVDAVFDEIELPAVDAPWREAVSTRLRSARQVLLQHPWAVPLMESRVSPGSATLRQHEATLAVLRAAGFTVAASAHAYALLDAFLYGFVLQESALPFGDADSAGRVASTIMSGFSTADFPHLVEIATEHVLRPGYDFSEEFEFGLALILDGLERLL